MSHCVLRRICLAVFELHEDLLKCRNQLLWLNILVRQGAVNARGRPRLRMLLKLGLDSLDHDCLTIEGVLHAEARRHFDRPRRFLVLRGLFAWVSVGALL